MEKIICEREILEKRKKEFKKAGIEKLAIFSDFERTLTKAKVKGKNVLSFSGILRESPQYLGKEYCQKAKALFEKYFPIEENTQIPIYKRKKAMQKWWQSHFSLLVKYGLTKKILKKIAKSKKIKLRRGVKKFFLFLRKHQIPLILISASGLGKETLEFFLKKEKLFFPNVQIISNEYLWDDNEKAIKIKSPILHSLNKDEINFKNFPHIYEKIKNRKNVILLGDMIEDVKMIKNFDYENVIKIGFLNERVSEKIKKYKKAFDCLILNDGSFLFVNKLLKEVI